MFLGERGRYSQAQKDQGAVADQSGQTAGADKPKKSVLPETDIRQIEDIAATRGPAAAAAQAIGLMDA